MDRIPLYQGIVHAGKIIFNGDRHAAHRVVQDRNGAHSQGKVVVDGHTAEQSAHRIHRVFTALLQPVAIGICVADLMGGRTDRFPIAAKNGDLCHGIAVDLEDDACLFPAVEDSQGQVIRHSLAPAALMLLQLHVVRTDQQQRGDVRIQAVSLAADGHVFFSPALPGNGDGDRSCSLRRLLAHVLQHTHRDDGRHEQCDDRSRSKNTFQPGLSQPALPSIHYRIHIMW